AFVPLYQWVWTGLQGVQVHYVLPSALLYVVLAARMSRALLLDILMPNMKAPGEHKKFGLTTVLLVGFVSVTYPEVLCGRAARDLYHGEYIARGEGPSIAAAIVQS